MGVHQREEEGQLQNDGSTFLKLYERVIPRQGDIAIGRLILMGPPRSKPQLHDNQRAGGWGRAGTVGGRWGNVTYDVFFLGKLRWGGG